jgi:lipopolysaccharide biosynthesis glycosyltransferase
MYNFCSITSVNYIHYTISLIRNLSNEKINILCLDRFSYNFFLKKNNKNLRIFCLKDLESEVNINTIKSNRTGLEFIFTIKPIFLYFIFKKIRSNSKLIYLDADIYFFKSVNYLKKALGLNSIFLTEHNFSEKNKDKEIFGKYNAGFLAFKKDLNGLEALKWWRKKCIYRCQFKATKHYFADQKYLNIFPKKFKKVEVLNKNIFNIAPWNLENLKKNNQNLIQLKIIFFHFQGLRFITNNIIQLGFSDYYLKDKRFITKIYNFYCLRLKKIIIKNNLTINISFFQRIRLIIRGLLKKDLLLFFKN